MARDVDVVLYGATGYTGRLAAAALDARGADFAIAGRDHTRLTRLSASLPSTPPLHVVALDDAAGLAAMAARAKVVLSCAGPYTTMGPPVVEAAISSGAHFADITGEQGFIRWCQDQDARARDAEVAVVNALGFDVVPSDHAAVLACRGLGPVRSLDIGIATKDGALSGGTRRSMAASTGAWWYYAGGRFRRAVPGRFLRTFQFPAPLGRRTGVFIPWGDCATAPRSTGARGVRTFFVIRPGAARNMHWSWPVTAVGARLPFMRRRLEDRAARSPEGPSLQARAKARFSILAEATADDGQVQSALVSGRDPYGLTGAAAAWGADALASGRVKGRGTLTPSQALDMEALFKEIGPDFELEPRILP